VNASYWRIYSKEYGTRTHLYGINDYTFCGVDTSGDDLIHVKPPEPLYERPSRITCPHCLQLLEIARSHFKP